MLQCLFSSQNISMLDSLPFSKHLESGLYFKPQVLFLLSSRNAWSNMMTWDFTSIWGVPGSIWCLETFFRGVPGSIWCLEARLFSTLGLHTDCARWGEAATSTYLLLQNSLGLLQNSAPPNIPAPTKYSMALPKLLLLHKSAPLNRSSKLL